MKVPDIDANCDCMFTNPEEIQKVWFGGRWKAKGFGFAPKCRTLFQAGGFLCLYSKKLCTSSWSWWMDENVFRTDNISELWKYGQENLPEILSKQLYQPQHQCLVALSILRPCGHFVCKPERYSQEILWGADGSTCGGGADRDSYFGCSGSGERRCGHREDFPACTWKAQGLHAGAGKHVTGKRVQGFIGTCWMIEIDEIQKPTLAILLVLTYFCLCSCLCFVSHYSRPVSTCFCARHVQ